MSEKKCNVMVGISTKQNTTNLVPFLQFNFSTMLILETNHSKKNHWGKNLKKVINSKDKEAKCENIGEGDNLAEMIEIIRGFIQDEEIICWNIGGGQKLQQTAIMQLYQERLQNNKKDWACYADAGSRKLFIITKENGQLISNSQTITARIKLADILTIFGLHLKEGCAEKLLWDNDRQEGSDLEDISNRNFVNFTDTHERQKMFSWFMKIVDLQDIGNAGEFYKIPRKLYEFIKQTRQWPGILAEFIKTEKNRKSSKHKHDSAVISKIPKQLFEEILPKILKEELWASEDTIPESLKAEYEKCKPKKPADKLKYLKKIFPNYFEAIVQYIIQSTLKKAKNHHVCQAWANVRAADSTDKETGEWDIVLVTSFGTLIILDAKTGIFPQKDEHARLYNLEKSSGVYGEFHVVFPFFWDDMKEDGFFAGCDAKWQKQRSTPLTLSERSSKFMAVMDEPECFVWQEKINDKKATLFIKKNCQNKTIDPVQVTNVDNFLKKLRLEQQ